MKKVDSTIQGVDLAPELGNLLVSLPNCLVFDINAYIVIGAFTFEPRDVLHLLRGQLPGVAWPLGLGLGAG